MMRQRLYLLGFAAALVFAAAIAAYNLYGALSFEAVPPGTMSWLSLAGLNDLQRGLLTGEAIKPQTLVAYLLLRTGLGPIASLEVATVAFFASIPLVVGIFARLVTKSLLVGGAAALLLSLFPFGYLSAVQGDYSVISAIALLFAALCPAYLFLQGRRLGWLALSAGFALLAGTSLMSGASVLFVVCLAWAASLVLQGQRRGALVVIPGVIALTSALAVPRVGAEAYLRQVSLASSMPDYLGVLALFAFASAVGGLVLLSKMRLDSAPFLILVGSGLALTLPLGWEGVLFVVPSAAVLVAAPLAEAKKLVSFVPPSVVEVDVERTFAVGVSFLTLSSPILAGLGPGLALQGTYYLGPEELATLASVRSLNPAVFGQGLVVAPPSIAPWLLTQSGVNAMVPLTANQSATVEALTSTSFRIQSSYLRVDEWTPIASVLSPLVSAFDGQSYASVVHLDDRQNRVNFTYGKQVLSEDTAGMKLVGHQFSRNAQNMTLTLQLSKFGFNLTKEIVVERGSSDVSIDYVVTPRSGSGLVSLSLPVFIVGEQRIQSTASGDTMHLAMTSSNASLSFPGGSKPRLTNASSGAYVKSTYNAIGGSIRASVAVSVESAKASGQGEQYTSLLDEISKDGISSIFEFTNPSPLNFLSNTVTSFEPSVDVKDAFNEILLTSENKTYVEAPSYANVTSESMPGPCDASFSYKTAGLTIVKNLTASSNPASNTVSLSYQVTPWKTHTTLREMNLTIWVPPERSLIDYHTNSTSVSMTLDSGTVVITPTAGHHVETEMGPDPIYGQQRVLLRFSLNPSGDRVGVHIAFGSRLNCQVVLSPRNGNGMMNGSDELTFSMSHGFSYQVYSNSAFTVYRLVQVKPNETA